MKAIRIHAPGGPEVMKLDDTPQPEPKAGEAVVKVDAAGLNYIDVYFRSGQYKANLPLTLGMEAGGTVAAVGPNVTEVKVGDKVAYTGVPGAYAEYAAVPAARLVTLPAGLTTKHGAAMMRAPRSFAIWQRSRPTPPAAECTRQVSPLSSGYVEQAR